jgi:hypothetical protein
MQPLHLIEFLSRVNLREEFFSFSLTFRAFKFEGDRERWQ